MQRRKLNPILPRYAFPPLRPLRELRRPILGPIYPPVVTSVNFPLSPPPPSISSAPAPQPIPSSIPQSLQSAPVPSLSTNAPAAVRPNGPSVQSSTVATALSSQAQPQAQRQSGTSAAPSQRPNPLPPSSAQSAPTPNPLSARPSALSAPAAANASRPATPMHRPNGTAIHSHPPAATAPPAAASHAAAAPSRPALQQAFVSFSGPAVPFDRPVQNSLSRDSVEPSLAPSQSSSVAQPASSIAPRPNVPTLVAAQAPTPASTSTANGASQPPRDADASRPHADASTATHRPLYSTTPRPNGPADADGSNGHVNSPRVTSSPQHPGTKQAVSFSALSPSSASQRLPPSSTSDSHRAVESSAPPQASTSTKKTDVSADPGPIPKDFLQTFSGLAFRNLQGTFGTKEMWFWLLRPGVDGQPVPAIIHKCKRPSTGKEEINSLSIVVYYFTAEAVRRSRILNGRVKPREHLKRQYSWPAPDLESVDGECHPGCFPSWKEITPKAKNEVQKRWTEHVANKANVARAEQISAARASPVSPTNHADLHGTPSRAIRSTLSPEPGWGVPDRAPLNPTPTAITPHTIAQDPRLHLISHIQPDRLSRPSDRSESASSGSLFDRVSGLKRAPEPSIFDRVHKRPRSDHGD